MSRRQWFTTIRINSSSYHTAAQSSSQLYFLPGADKIIVLINAAIKLANSYLYLPFLKFLC